MRSYDLLYDRSNLIKIILYHHLSRDRLLINHLSFDLPNLFGQPLELTF